MCCDLYINTFIYFFQALIYVTMQNAEMNYVDTPDDTNKESDNKIHIDDSEDQVTDTADKLSEDGIKEEHVESQDLSRDPLSTDSEGAVLYVGRLFSSIEETKDFVKKYLDSKFARMVICKNDERALKYVCYRSRYRASESKGVRKNNHFVFTGCKAQIRLSKRKNGTVILTLIEECHNHALEKEEYSSKTSQISDEEKDLIKMLGESNVKPGQISRVLEQKFGKKVAIKKIINILAQLRNNEDPGQLEEYLNQESMKSGMCVWKENDEKEASALMVSSSEMKNMFLDRKPPLIQIDTTFNMDKSQYKVCGFCYLDPRTNSTIMAAVGFMEVENHENFEFLFNRLKELSGGRDDFIFIIDKDFREIHSLETVFPNSEIILCRFHVIKYMKGIIASAVIPVEEKHTILSAFKAVVYARSEDDYDRKNRAFKNEVYGVMVNPPGNQQPVTLCGYYERRWESCAPKWVAYHRSRLVTLQDNTNNRIERLFRTCKQAAKEKFRSLPSPESLIIFLLQFLDRRHRDIKLKTESKRLRIFSNNKIIRENNEIISYWLTERGCILWNKVQEQVEEKIRNGRIREVIGEGVEEIRRSGEKFTYETDATSCT